MKEKTIEKLLSLKEQINDAKIQLAETSGSLKSSLQRLKEEFKVDSLDKAQVKLKRLQEEQLEIEEEISDAVEKLEKEYDWE